MRVEYWAGRGSLFYRGPKTSLVSAAASSREEDGVHTSICRNSVEVFHRAAHGVHLRLIMNAVTTDVLSCGLVVQKPRTGNGGLLHQSSVQ